MVLLIKKDNKKTSLDTIIGFLTMLFAVILVVFFMKTQGDISRMEEELLDVEKMVEHQRLVNKDLEITLREEDSYFERMAREKLDYAHPEERVFIDASGAK